MTLTPTLVYNAVLVIAIGACALFLGLMVVWFQLYRLSEGLDRRLVWRIMILLAALAFDQVFWTVVLHLPPGTLKPNSWPYVLTVTLFLVGRAVVPIIVLWVCAGLLRNGHAVGEHTVPTAESPGGHP